ncbi:MAG: DUF885 domain-containing protein [Gammaproteobacteria bacterium]|nr:DUF885 domain-containing protein [Gammaproteobacteria bacterium]
MSENNYQQTFNALLEQYYNAWFRYHPEQAVQVGVPGYEEMLRAYNDDEIGALISLDEKMLSALDELNFEQLSDDQQVDYSILYNSVVIELHELLEHDWRYCRPQDYVPVEAIHQLLTRPVENLHAAIKHRLQLIPDYLRGARAYISQKPGRIPAGWLNSACKQAEAGARYFRGLMSHPQVLKKFENPARLQPICDEAAIAMDDFARFLKQEIGPRATGDYACGADFFSALLNDAHFLPITPDQLHSFGEQLYKEIRQQMQALAVEIQGHDDINGLLAGIRDSHPDAGDSLLSAYRERMKAAYDFVRENKLVSMPEKQQLKVLETPEYLRHEIPFAAYEEPTYKDESQQGHYYVTPVVSEGQLLEHNWISIDLTCVHEAFPGHHLQFVTANSNPHNSLPRLINASATLYEGWALYCEDLMQEQGFLGKPEHKFMMLRDRLWRALRVMLDVELHTRDLSIDDAAQRMCTELGFDHDHARADLSWYTQNPTLPMGYATGWALIRAVRGQLEAQADFDLEGFHNNLLSVGSCALAMVIKRSYGDDVWQNALQQVFTTRA